MHKKIIVFAIALAFPLSTLAASTSSGVGAGGSASGGTSATGPGGGTSGSLGSVGTTGGSVGLEKPGSKGGAAGTASGSGSATTPQGTTSSQAGAGGSSSQQLDTNKDGFVSREEAARASSDVRSRFNQLDKDGDGRLTPQEMSGGGRASGSASGSAQPGTLGNTR